MFISSINYKLCADQYIYVNKSNQKKKMIRNLTPESTLGTLSQEMHQKRPQPAKGTEAILLRKSRVMVENKKEAQPYLQ